MLEKQSEKIAVAMAKVIYKGRIRGSKEFNKEFLSKYPEVIKHQRKGQSNVPLNKPKEHDLYHIKTPYS